MCFRMVCISPEKKEGRIFKDLKLHKTLSKENHIHKKQSVFCSDIHLEKTLFWSFPSSESSQYCNTSIQTIKEKVKCEFRPQQKVIQVNLYLRSLKVQIYNIVEWKIMQGVSIANYVCLQQILKKLTQVFSCSKFLRCRKRRSLRFLCIGPLTQERSFGKNRNEMNLVEFPICVCVSPSGGNENSDSSEDSRAAYHVQHCSSKICRKSVLLSNEFERMSSEGVNYRTECLLLL